MTVWKSLDALTERMQSLLGWLSLAACRVCIDYTSVKNSSVGSLLISSLDFVCMDLGVDS